MPPIPGIMLSRIIVRDLSFIFRSATSAVSQPMTGSRCPEDLSDAFTQVLIIINDHNIFICH